ncbi:unnamed protein product [Urochloa decumbens]|uniref:Uncharacterized protein n=1 Tax=Urochloa decumbens TaxID=240449 RepID=A0ABC9B8I2_9POAL
MANSLTPAAYHGWCPFETSSRCVTKRVQAAHNFEVIDFSLLDGVGAGKFVHSSTFCAGGRDWNIRLYPDGWKEEDKAAYVSVFLCLVDGPNDAKAKYTLSLLGEDGKVSELGNSATMLSYTFGSAGGYWGFNKFIEKSKLGLYGDCFTIRCVLTLIGDTQIEDPSIMVDPPSNIHKHFEQMLKDGKGMDVTFNVDGRLFHAHRCVLAARSPVFEAELYGRMKENATDPINVDEMEPSIFEELLYFLYTDSVSDKCDIDNNMAMQHLLVAADRYGLDRLRLMCEVKLCHDIDAQTVATTLALAEQNHCMHLKDACLRFVASRDVLGVVMKTDVFKHLVESYPMVTVEILDKIAKAMG